MRGSVIAHIINRSHTTIENWVRNGREALDAGEKNDYSEFIERWHAASREALGVAAKTWRAAAAKDWRAARDLIRANVPLGHQLELHGELTHSGVLKVESTGEPWKEEPTPRLLVDRLD